MVYVEKSGSDITGNGTIAQPYLTIPYALSTITDASPTKRYAILLGPGTYPDNFNLKANVFIVGTSYFITRITGTITINDPTWAVAGDNRSGFMNVSLSGPAITMDFTTQSANEGKLYFTTVTINNLISFIAYSSINQVFMTNSYLFAGFSQLGISMVLSGVSILNAGPITINSTVTPNTVPAIVEAFSGSCDGTASITSQGGITTTVNLYNFFCAGLNISGGATTTVNATISSVPVGYVLGVGATLTNLTPASILLSGIVGTPPMHSA
jgi:hypothetical protein